jgi:hypothetical protein
MRMIGLSAAWRWISVRRWSGSCSVKKPPPEIAEHEDRRAEAHQVAAELLVDHRAFVDDHQRGLGDRALPVEREGRVDRGLARGLVLHRLLAARAVDQRMDGAGVGRPLRAQHLRRLAGEGGELHLSVDVLGEVARQRRLAGAGIAEQAKERRAPFLQPAGDGLQRLVLLRGKLHGRSVRDSPDGSKPEKKQGPPCTSRRSLPQSAVRV